MNNRERLIEIAKKHQLSHLGSCLTALPIIEEIYAEKKPEEKFVLSAGHAHLAHLVVKEGLGLLNAEEALEKGGIHCDRKVGCDVSTGSLGQGLGIATGMALSDRSKNVYVLVSDGEMSEGSVWEALRVAKEQGLYNLKIYLNANGWGAYGPIDIQQLVIQIEAFGFPVKVRLTNSDIGTWTTGLLAHYKVADKDLK